MSPFAVLVMFAALAMACAVAFPVEFQDPAPVNPPAADRISDAFAMGWMLADTNGDGIADFINGKVVVPAHPTAAENSAAADFAARLGFGTTGLTPPLVLTAANDSSGGPRIWVGKDALPQPAALELAPWMSRLQKDEGGVFATGGNVAVVGADDGGLLAAAEGYSARAPYQWKVPGDRMSAIADAVRAAAADVTVELIGVTYLRGKAGVHRAYLRNSAEVTSAALSTALDSARLAGIHELIVVSPTFLSAVSSKPEAATQTIPPSAPAAAAGNADAAATAAPVRLDLATLYTSRGLFTGTPRMPLPSTLDAHLYVPAGAPGVAMANLAARMGLETTGINLPLATPVSSAATGDVRMKAVIAGDSALREEAERKLRAQDTAAVQSETELAPGEGELRIVDDAFGRRPAVIARGDQSGSAAAVDYLATHMPNLWETGKQHVSIEEIRYDLHRFFSLRSAAGQSAMALYHLDRWMTGAGPGAKDVRAEVYVDVADPKLAGYVRQQVEQGLHVPGADIKVGSLHAGTRCCDQLPNLHYRSQQTQFQPSAPTFTEDIVIPWEGRRLMDAVKKAAAKITRGQKVQLVARVSEGPDQRRKLEAQLKDMLIRAGADSQRLNVEVLCAYKPGYS